MNIASAIVVYVIIWWIVFFMALPVGVRSQEESEDEVVPGTHESAPEKPMLWWKAFFTTIIAAVLFGLYYLADKNGWFGLFS